jgi:hypothetical protein
MGIGERFVRKQFIWKERIENDGVDILSGVYADDVSIKGDIIIEEEDVQITVKGKKHTSNVTFYTRQQLSSGDVVINEKDGKNYLILGTLFEPVDRIVVYIYLVMER